MGGEGVLPSRASSGGGGGGGGIIRGFRKLGARVGKDGGGGGKSEGRAMGEVGGGSRSLCA